jgi:hypothetical protein
MLNMVGGRHFQSYKAQLDERYIENEVSYILYVLRKIFLFSKEVICLYRCLEACVT